MLIDERSAATVLRIVPLAPLLVALLHGVSIGLVRRELPPRAVAPLSLAALGVSLLASVLAFAQLIAQGQVALVDRVAPWFGAGVGPEAFVAGLVLRFDPLAAVSCMLVCGVGLIALVYAIDDLRGDARDDRGEQRFHGFALLGLGAMLLFVLADDVLVLVAAWSLLGLATAWLLGFWYADERHARASTLIFFVGRLGDAALLGAVGLLVVARTGAGGATTGLAALREAGSSVASGGLAWPAALGGGALPWAELVAGLVVLAIVARAAQLPFSGWLGETVAAPTTALVLAHSVLSVAAPVLLGVRLGFLFADAPVAAAVLVWTGAVTALVGALIACAKTDVLSLLAWSTVSQIGYALVATGAAEPTVAVFQLLAHAFAKALLLMALGVVVAAVGRERDLARMGNLGSRLWRTRAQIWIAVASLTGLAPLTIGFFAVEQVVVAAAEGAVYPGRSIAASLVLIAVATTAFGSVRLVHATLYGDTRLPPSIRWDKLEDPPRRVLVAMGVLAALVLVGGLFGMPQIWADLLFAGVADANSLRDFLAPALGVATQLDVDPARQWALAGLAALAALLGAGLAFLLHFEPRVGAPASWPALAHVREALRAGLGLGPALGRAIGGPLPWLAERVLAPRVEAGLVERLTLRTSAGTVHGLANGVVRRLQSGSALRYLGTSAFALAVVLLLLLRAARG